MFKIKIEKKFNCFRIYVNDLIHVSIKESELMSYHSYIEGYKKDANYIIKFYTTYRIIKCTYDSFEKWRAMLKKIDEKI